MRCAILSVLLVAFGAPSFAADTVDTAIARRGAMVRDVNNVRLGQVSRVNDDGSAAIIFDLRMVTVPATTLSLVDGKLVTSLTKKQVSAIR